MNARVHHRPRILLELVSVAAILGCSALVAAPPLNDLRANATVLTAGQTISGTTVEATREAGDSVLSPSLERVVWHEWTATADGWMEAVLSYATPASAYPQPFASVSVFRAETGGALTPLAFGARISTETNTLAEFRDPFLRPPDTRHWQVRLRGSF